MGSTESASASLRGSMAGAAIPAAVSVPKRHSALVRATHWITALCFVALLVTGVEILISHPRFYWGETGNVLTKPLFTIPIPASRAMVKTGYNYVLPDQNGWSRALHFQAAWFLVLTGAVYVVWGLLSGHLVRALVPEKGTFSVSGIFGVLRSHLRLRSPAEEAWSYNVLQRVTYLLVIFVAFPLVIWTGLAMSPSFVSAVPATVTLLGGQQSARTIHFFVTIGLVAFLAVHVAMIFVAGFWKRMRAMITGAAERP